MIGMDVFKQDAFSATSLTTAVDQIGYKPSFLGTIAGLFVDDPVRTQSIMIEERSNGPALIQTDQRGAPPKRRGAEQRKIRAFSTLRIAEVSRIMASELQNIRSFGQENALKSVQEEIARRQFLLRQDFDLTMEFHRVNAIMATALDADGTTLYDWATEFNQTYPAEAALNIAAAADGALFQACNVAKRSVLRGLKGLGGNAVSFMALCGDAFWDDFTGSAEVRKTYLNTQEAKSLRNDVGNAFDMFNYGGITWVNYRSTDDAGATPTVGIPTDKAKMFPVGAGIFRRALSPGEGFDFVNTLGREVYAQIVPDPTTRNAYVDVELAGYPLFVCTMPQALYRFRRGA
jgi:hypothetical protein